MNRSIPNIYFPCSESTCWMPQLLEENCAVCGDQVRSNRLGSPACQSCILFFRRAVIKNTEYICWKTNNCPTSIEFRASCKHCRYQKCLHVGMKPEFVVIRDTLGPRTAPLLHPEFPNNLMVSLVRMQKKQYEKHQGQNANQMRRATVSDVNNMLEWSFNDAVEWASLFDPFRLLSNEHQTCVISEYGVAFFIIDQGFKSASEWKTGYLMLQNGAFLHSDYFHGLENSGIGVDQEVARQHHEFVNFLETSIKLQFQTLQIDEFETASLKALLLFSNSFSKQNIFAKSQNKVDSLKNKCLEELMEYLTRKWPNSHDERFGNLIIFLGKIREAIKIVYNQTKISDVFDSSKFNVYVQSFLLS